MDESKSKSLKIIQNLPKWGKIVRLAKIEGT